MGFQVVELVETPYWKKVSTLTVREKEIFKDILDMYCVKGIAKKHDISVKTVKFHTTRIYTKLGLDQELNGTTKKLELFRIFLDYKPKKEFEGVL